MGAKDSKQSCICFEDSLKRVTDNELKRIKEAFKRSVGSNGTLLSKNAFIQDVLCDGVPPIVADWLYNACGGTQKGIGFKELFCGLVLLTKGTPDEKIRFLWTLYSNESNTLIIKSDFLKALHIETTYQSNNTNNTTPAVSATLNKPNNSLNYNYFSLFGHSNSVTFEQFRSWILMHKSATVLSKWLLVDSCVTLSSELDTPTFYLQHLAGVTHLEEQEIGDLEKVFWFLKGLSISGQLDVDYISHLMNPPVPKSALEGIFLAFDENRDGHIDFKELCCGISAACRGPDVERTKFCFKIFDIDRDGVLNFNEIEQTINILLQVAKESNSFAAFKTTQFDQVMVDIYSYVVNNNNNVNLCYPADLKLPQEDFLMWCLESALNIVQPFLDLLFEMCHIIFCLKPQCKHLEFDIVRGFLSREVRRGYEVGQFWYLIATDWWQNWLQYTQSNQSQTPCVYCKSFQNYRLMQQHSVTSNQAHGNGNGHGTESVDEAMVCDESFASNVTESIGDLIGNGDSSSLGSRSSGISLGKNHQMTPPGPIDNSSLLATNPFKNVQTLTGEGAPIKKETLIQHRDFELVPDTLWKTLAQWYGGPLPLPRQVIKPPNSNVKELEFYPLNLRIFRHQMQTNTQQQNNNIGSGTWSSISGGYGALSGSYTNVSPMQNTLQVPKKYLAYTAAFSRLATVKQVGDFLSQRLKLKYDDIRLWHIIGPYSSTTQEIPYMLEEESMTLQELMINDNDQILLEVRNKDLTWPEELSSLSNDQPNAYSRERRATIASVQSVHPPGATGLHNLGNTCFMNSALQVLFNTQPLTNYFRQNSHLYELNLNNKMGTKGQLAIRYAELLKEVWTASTRSIAPLKFRFCVTKFAPQFGGGVQNDAQELLHWLLDTLNEDLNRITEKPYTELKDSDGRADQIVAMESWQQYHSRNNSIIVDLFYGQLKSKVSCLTCGFDSVRFDPFSLLSLPLPVENYTYCEVVVLLLNGSSVPVKYGIRLNSECKYWDLKNQLACLCNLEAERMLVCELTGSQIKCILPNDQKIKPSTASELFIFELPNLEEFQQKQRSRAGSEMGIQESLKDIQRNQGDFSLEMKNVSLEHQPMTSNSNTSSISSTDDPNGLLSLSSNGRKIEDPDPSKHQSADISTSPMSTFIDSSNSGTYNATKTISTINLLEATTNLNLCDDTELRDLPGNESKEICLQNSLSDSSSCSNCNVKKMNDSLPANENVDLDDDRNSNSSTAIKHCVTFDTKCGYLIAIHRKLSRQDTYFLSHQKTRPSLFGVPILIPLYDGVKNRDLYNSVWIQVARLLSPLPPTPPDQANHATDCDDSLGYDFPFTLRIVAENGRFCALCPWPQFCRGCTIPCNDESFLHGIVPSSCTSSNTSTPNLSHRDGISPNSTYKVKSIVNTNSMNVAIDWDPTALHLRYQSTREKEWKEHSSVAICRRQQIEPIDLDYCLRAFTTEEKLEQGYHCSKCKSKQPATKKLQLWKLPPILVVHLKRFNYVNNKWVKSQKVVNFPFKNFDPTPYLASVPQETILRYKELMEQKKSETMKNIRNHDCNDEIIEFDLENQIGLLLDENNECTNDEIGSTSISTKTQKSDNQINVNCNDVDKKKSDCNNMMSKQNARKRLVSTSLTKTPIVDGEFADYNNHKLKSNQDPFDLKYDLYAVVSHSGMLNGGHYVSYVTNMNGNWNCYNDSSVREIPQQPNIDPSSAYLLFYERRNLDYFPYIPKNEGKQPIFNGPNIDEESENDLKKMCVLS